MNRLVEDIDSVVGRAGPAATNGGRAPSIESAANWRGGPLSADELVEFAKALAAGHRVDRRRRGSNLLDRLRRSEREIGAIRGTLAAVVAGQGDVTPAEEWILDNFHLVQEQAQAVRRNLPRSYNRELPCLENGLTTGTPRVYDIARQLVRHADGRVGPNALRGFVAGYQEKAVLTIGELWALPIMLSIVLIEYLDSLGRHLLALRADRGQAAAWAERMRAAAKEQPNDVVLVLADMARSKPPQTATFVAELVRQLQGHDRALALPLDWIERWLAGSGLTIGELVQADHQQQAAGQVSISNSIGTLRFVNESDWRTIVEELGVVDSWLRKDPAGVYARMDFPSRDRYRRAVEQLARASSRDEVSVASKALLLARQARAPEHVDGPESHVGFYLIDEGRPALEHALGIRPSVALRANRLMRKHAAGLYVGSILALSALVAVAVLRLAGPPTDSPVLLVTVLIALLLVASQTVVAVVNRIAAALLEPVRLPRLDYRDGVPPESTTLVVVPAMLANAEGVAGLLSDLEVRFLGNRDPGCHFALLTDLLDADRERTATDESLVRQAADGIEALNRAHGARCFHLLHRSRCWNPTERTWMGRERKRGKLADLNAFLRGGGQTAFSTVVGDTSALVSVRFVITLDADTELPRDTARELAGALAHPLNRPRLDPKRRRVSRGYAILQPRVALSPLGRSPYARLWGGDSSLDPYTRLVSDTYQDAFGEGSFVGKGIYDVDAVDRVLEARLPDNKVLSHDLLEGCHARCGFLSDVQLLEDHPEDYLADARRRHRWVRGDWQISGWLRRRVPTGAGARERNPLSLLAQWKIADNLRRSLVPVASVALFVVGWTATTSPVAWTFALLALLFAPTLLDTVLDLLAPLRPATWRGEAWERIARSGQHWARALLALAWLPHEAACSLDAAARSLWRLLVSGRRLLEWQPASGSVPAAQSTLAAYLRAMRAAPLVALAVATWLALTASAPIALPILALWFLSPLLAWRVSRPSPVRESALTPAQARELARAARRTWAFFEQFVGPRGGWLPPDNYQEDPVGRVAYRTSPTNLGLALLANLGAYDLGFLSAGRLLERTARMLEAMERLERHAGHFLNWYDTERGTPLHPRYVSSVDSGNLIGHLLVLRAGLAELAGRPVVEQAVFTGLRTTLELVEASEAHDERAIAQVRRLLDELTERPSADVAELHGRLSALLAAARDLGPPAVTAGASSAADIVPATDQDAAPASDPASAPVVRWTQRLVAQCEDVLEDLRFLVPCSDDPPGPVPTLAELAAIGGTDEDRPESRPAAPLQVSGERARARIKLIEQLSQRCAELAQANYACVFDASRKQFAIGYNVSDRRRDTSFYDLLASEARFAVFVAISQGSVPQESWFALGRSVTRVGGRDALVSWDGSMFEYLMPHLVMPAYPGTLIHESCRAAVARQIQFGRERDVPWGVSESGYYLFDAHSNYQYRAFGVPGLGLRRGIGEDLVVAPYATCLALLVAPVEACRNLERLRAEGMAGEFGFYEAVDYTAARLAPGATRGIVRSYMAHHQAMSLLAMVAVLCDRPMQRRFESESLFRTSLLLLHEQPRAGEAIGPVTSEEDAASAIRRPEPSVRAYGSPDTPSPEVHLLSNGRYHVMVTNAGGGYSRWRDVAVTRWREDSTCDDFGVYCYLRDADTGRVWSVTHQPALVPAEQYSAVFTEGRAEFTRRDRDFESVCEIAVSPEDDVELRRVRLTNRSRTRRTVELTSYVEFVLDSPAAEALHPAFSKLFLETEIVADKHAILCTRRPRSPSDATPWAFHLMAIHGAHGGAASFETDRSRFLGRGGSVGEPLALARAAPLSGAHGAVLDPIGAIRREVQLAPDETVIVDLALGCAVSRQACVALADKYRDRRLADRVAGLAWTHGQMALRQVNASEAQAQHFGRLASRVLYASGSMRADGRTLEGNRRGQSGLWGHGISGDLPIVLLRITSIANRDLARQMIQAHTYWRMRGLAVDLVVWNEDRAGYRQELHDEILGMVAAEGEASFLDRPGGVFVRNASQLAEEDRVLILSVARLVVNDTASIEDQLEHRGYVRSRGSRLKPVRAAGPDAARERKPDREPEHVRDRERLACFNGTGGFDEQRGEYVVATVAGAPTPSPWVNVLANPRFGCVISESGASYTWLDNAHEFRLSPWHNDPVADPTGEAFYIRDEETGRFWCPTPAPRRGNRPYRTRHGFGYSVFEHKEEGIASELEVFVDRTDPIKYTVLRLRNDSAAPRRLSVVGYVEWVLGDLRHKWAMHVVTSSDPLRGVVRARNAYNSEFPDCVAYFDVDPAPVALTGDRTEFIGRNGSLRNPAALFHARLSGRLGAALDPCAALQALVELAPGEQRDIVFRLGAASTPEDGARLFGAGRGAAGARAALAEVKRYWTETLGAVRLETPDPAVNLLGNGWLLYQAIASRFWGRSGFYQSGGAFGFRDQLQDSMALVHADGALTRAHLLACAGRQFAEGDVQHWWHPPAGRGVRTRCSDDRLWLPLATARYVLTTGDTGVLQETAGYIRGRPLNADEESYYDLPVPGEVRESLYAHCVRAITASLERGAHGLPLIGSGDWNDGMNLVGAGGRGESVWLGFFLQRVLLDFTEVAMLQGDHEFAATCQAEVERLRGSLETGGWDGEWYRRAYFDDGTPLGSRANTECRIDSVAQSWAVLAGAGNEERAAAAMDAVYRHLVQSKPGIVPLLDPPFDEAQPNPGYIRGYLPGVRENGGQYNHAAIWVAMAFAELGQAERAWEVLRLVSPIHRTLTPQAVAAYRAEPYVVAADVLANDAHFGRGGWTWYTGSAGWMYRLILESLLGLQRIGTRLRFRPCLPSDWSGYRLHYRFRSTRYVIDVVRHAGGSGELQVTLDGAEQPAPEVPLADDRIDHAVTVRVGGQ